MAAVAVHIIGVSGDAEAVAERFADAGHTVTGPKSVSAAEAGQAVREAPGAEVCVIVGGVGPRDGVPASLDGVITTPLPGFGELLRALIFPTDPAAAVASRAFAGLTAGPVVFALPAEPAWAALAIDRLILPDLDRYVTTPASAKPTPTPIPFRPAQRSSVGLSASEGLEPTAGGPAAEADPDLPPPGWRRAVHALGAELTIGRAEELPEPIEKLAPVVNVLHTAGEFGTLKLPSGRRYSVFGWPDLRRDNAKVLAVGWGDPLAEIVALHRHPREAGTCVTGPGGMLTRADSPVDAVCVAVTGRAPADTSGTVFAVQEGTVWILRARRVVQWDGSREKDDGNPKQVLSSLALHWSNR